MQTMQTMQTIKKFSIPLLLLAALVASAVVARPSAPQVARDGYRPADAEAVAIVHAVNRFEIDMGKLALTMPLARPTQDVAGMLVKQHTQNDSKLQALKAPASESEQVKLKQAELDRESARLKSLPRDGFEVAYIHAMSQGHQHMLEFLKQRVPTTHDRATRDFLFQTQKDIERHYSEIRKLEQGAVGK